MPLFECEVNGKFILTGEHAVLRGGEALVFPIKGKHLKLKYLETKKALSFISEGPIGKSELDLVFWSLLERALGLVGRTRSDLLGEIRISNGIPLGAGLGASSALCVSFAKWFRHFGWLVREELFPFARELENMFHGESSGVDIAVALSQSAIRYSQVNGPQPLVNVLKPRFFLSYCGVSGKTVDCVTKVKQLLKLNPIQGNEIDKDMIHSSRMASQALQMSHSDGMDLLADAMTIARSCFERWGLTEGQLHEHILKVLESGAKSAKPTGSGGGGYVLSLWIQPPPGDLGLVEV